MTRAQLLQATKLSNNNIPSASEKSEGAVGGQIDMMIDRKDGVINVCEMKFYKEPFVVTKEYADKVRTRNAIFRDQENCRKALVNTLVTTYGLVRGKHSEVFEKVITMEPLAPISHRLTTSLSMLTSRKSVASLST